MERENQSLSSNSSEHRLEENEGEDSHSSQNQILTQKLNVLTREKIEKNILARCINSIRLGSYLSKHSVPFSQEVKHCKRTKSKDEIWQQVKELMTENDNLNAGILYVCEENRRLEKAIREKKLQLKSIMKERMKDWNQAVVAHQLSLGKVKDPETFDLRALDFSNLPLHGIQKFYENKFKLFSAKNADHCREILQLCVILHNLVCFSGKPWAQDKNLSSIVLYTGKALEMNFGAESDEDKKKAVDDLIHGLNNVKI